MKILLTGGSGLLGQELQKYLDCVAPSSEGLDITKDIVFGEDWDIVIHSAGYTDVPRAETERVNCFKVNVTGTYNLVKAYPKAKFIFISSEYAHKPLNFYSFTKKWAEGIVKKLHSNYLIIRTSFVSDPFPHDLAFADQYTQGDYIHIIAPMIATEILKDTNGLKYIGTERKTMFELARRTKPDISGNSVDDIKEVKLPKDYL